MFASAEEFSDILGQIGEEPLEEDEDGVLVPPSVPKGRQGSSAGFVPLHTHSVFILD